jgi:hypothetical protein
MIKLKKLKPENISSALEMARMYRQLSDPDEAESICMDILDTEPGNQGALIMLILSLTDKFSESEMLASYERAVEIVNGLDDRYCKFYYSGIIYERRAKYHFKMGSPGSGGIAYGWYERAMEAFGKALNSCDPDNQDALLRWNSCARFINNHPELKPVDSKQPGMLLDAFETPH